MEKSAQKTLCESLKEALHLLAPDQNLATVNADFAFTGDAGVRLNAFTVDKSLASFGARFAYGADVGASGTIEFIPNNLAGVLVCIARWKAPILISAHAAPTSVDVNGTLKIDPVRTSIEIDALFPSLDLTFAPPPFVALFGENPSLIYTCPLLFTAGVGDGIYALLDASYNSTIWSCAYAFDSFALDYSFAIPGINIPPRFNWPALSLKLFDDRLALTWQQ